MNTLQRERGTATGCGSCGCSQALTIDMTVSKTGPKVTLTSCPRCEHRVWTTNTGILDRTDVLQVLSGREDFILKEKERGIRRRAA